MKEWAIAFGKVLLWLTILAWASWMLGWCFMFDQCSWWVNTLSAISFVIYLTIIFKLGTDTNG